METVTSTREKLHLEYNAKGLLFVVILIPAILFVFATCIMSSNVSIECVKASGPAIAEEDTCTIVSTTLLGSTSLGAAVFPSFLTGTKNVLSLKYLESFTVDEHITTSTDEDGNEDIRISYNLNFHQRVPESVKTPGLTTDSFGLVYDFGSSAADAQDLRRRLQVFLETVHAHPTAPALFHRSIDERYSEEVLSLVSAVIIGACAYFMSVKEVVVVEAASNTLHLATYTWLGVNKVNVVVPLQYVTGTSVEEQVQETRTNGRYERRFVYRVYLQLVHPPQHHGGAPGEPYTLDLMLGQTVDERSRAQAVASVLDSWIREHKRRTQRRAQRERVHPASDIDGEGGGEAAESAALLGNGSPQNRSVSDAQLQSGEERPENVLRARSRPPTQPAGDSPASAAAASSPVREIGPDSPASAPSVAVNEGERVRLCVICWDENKEVKTVFLPCKHMVCCEDCADAVDKCPMCRTQITSTIDVFL